MKKFNHIILSLILGASAVCGAGCQQDPVETLKKSDIPDYSGYTDQMDFFGYHSTHDGYYTIDDVKYYVGESFMTTEQYQMYKDAGMTMAYPQSVMKIRGETGAMRDSEAAAEKFYADRAADWEKVKLEIDKYVSVGIDKTILYDEDLSWIGLNEPNRVAGDNIRDDEDAEVEITDGKRTAKGLIGTDKDQYASEEELDAQVEKLLSLYAGYPGVGGVCLADEPKNVWYKSYGDLYNSIKRVSEKNGWDLYISFNLNPLNLNKLVYDEYYPYVEGTGEAHPITEKTTFEDGFARYKQYIQNFMSSMQPDYIRYDDYPLRYSYLSSTYIPCLEYIAGVARDMDIKFHMVTQTFGMNSNGTQSMRKLTEPGAKWLNNMLLGFGVNEISYFTYYTRTESKTEGESFWQYNDCSFVDIYGQKTAIYDLMKKIIANNQKFAPTVLQFKYVKSGIFSMLPMDCNADHIQYMPQNVQTYEKVKSVTVNKECAMVNELYDKENDRYMYMAMNIVDPENKGSKVYQTITLEFAPEYKYALVYRDGTPSLYRLKGSKLEVKGGPGEASFVIPF